MQGVVLVGAVAFIIWQLFGGQGVKDSQRSTSSAVQEKEATKAAATKAVPKKAEGKAEGRRKDAATAGGSAACAFSFKGHTGTVTHMRCRFPRPFCRAFCRYVTCIL